MKQLRLIPTAIIVLMGTGCATMKGDTKEMYLDTTPSGGTCTITTRTDERVLYSDILLPRTLELEKGVGSLDIVCNKEGFKEVETQIGVEWDTAAVLGSGLLLGPLGIGVDMGSGAMFTYPDSMTIRLERE